MMRSDVSFPPSCGRDRAHHDRQGDHRRERARGKRDRAVEARHLLEPAHHAEHELRPQPERQRADDALALRQVGRHSRGEIAANAAASSRGPIPADAGARGGDRLRRRREALVEARGEVARAHAQVDLEEPLQAPRLEVAGAGQHLLAVADERLRVQHLRVSEDAHARVEQVAVVEALGGRAGAVVGARGHEEADAHAAVCSADDAPDHRLVGDVRVDHVERLARTVEQLGDGRRDRAVGTGRVVQDRRGHRARLGVREERRQLLRRHAAAEPAEAGDEHELELRDDRPGHAHEQVVEAAVGEVVLDPRATDPADAAVDDEQLAVVDASHRAHDLDVDPAGPQPLVEAARLAGARADAVDDDADRDALGGLGEQHAGELLADRAGAEAVLVDVHRRRRGADVVEDQREEVAPLHVHVDGGGGRLLEHEREVAQLHRCAHQRLGAGAQLVHGWIVRLHGATLVRAWLSR